MNLAQLTRTLFARTSAGRPGPSHSVRLQLEGLTERITPDVTATVANGVLTVKATGAAFNDWMTVEPVDGFAGRFLITGLNQTFVSGDYDAVGVTSMKFDLGEGNDRVELDNVVLAGGISFRGGNGNNTFRLDNSLVGGSVSVTNLANIAGDDSTTFFRSTVNGGVTVNNGLGSAQGQFAETNILGSLRYTTPSTALIPGNDSILIDGLVVGGSVALSLANGTNSFGASGFFNPLEVGGSFSYAGGSGSDTIQLFDAIIGASATIALGDNNNSLGAFNTDGLFVGGKLTVTGGAGNDSINLNPSAVARVNGAAAFNLGAGNNNFTTTGLRVGSLRLTTGAGNDTGNLYDLTVVGAAVMNFGAGTNTVDLAVNGDSAVGGAFTLTTGSGPDTVRVGGSAFRVGGAARFTLGTTAVFNGDNSLQINNALFASTLGIIGGGGIDTLFLANLSSVGVAGRLTVTANAGNDQLKLGVVGDPGKVVRLLVLPTLNGGAGSGDSVTIFPTPTTGGNVQGPPGVTVYPTGLALVAAGWEVLI